ncbi:uncharacterized protein DUF664 [Knoellia remsis]|uniref:Uncharacterized protein DUF664 n=1 Tax=Knoellia remsis TaxID=407159 RepID=A0A2T0UXC4_9MICO|nr:DinB family protein [Knoellia remsis]PRY62585.1 uncharacterized protein DUF664 [Knoellia remsis]
MTTTRPTTAATSATAARTTAGSTTTLTGERADLVESLRRHRGFLLTTVQNLSDEQARERSTVSELTLGGLVKHVTQTEAQWATFMREGAGTAPDIDWESIDWSNPPAEVRAFQDSHRLLDDETLAHWVEEYERVAAATDELVATLDLDTRHDLPRAPWFEPGAQWSVRRAVLHIIAETSQHAGHADIIRESIDGQKTMG